MWWPYKEATWTGIKLPILIRSDKHGGWWNLIFTWSTTTPQKSGGPYKEATWTPSYHFPCWLTSPLQKSQWPTMEVFWNWHYVTIYHDSQTRWPWMVETRTTSQHLHRWPTLEVTGTDIKWPLAVIQITRRPDKVKPHFRLKYFTIPITGRGEPITKYGASWTWHQVNTWILIHNTSALEILQFAKQNTEYWNTETNQVTCHDDLQSAVNKSQYLQPTKSPPNLE